MNEIKKKTRGTIKPESLGIGLEQAPYLKIATEIIVEFDDSSVSEAKAVGVIIDGKEYTFEQCKRMAQMKAFL